MTRDGRKHGLNRERINAALDNATFIGAEGDREYYIGVDSRGIEIEMIIVPDDKHPGGLACIHAMPLHFREINDEEE